MKCYRCNDWPCTCRDGQTIIHGDCREVLPQLEPVDLVLTDPPYGCGKADWDDSLPLDWLEYLNCDAMAITPGLWNILKMPERIGQLEYRWQIAAHLINGMTRGAVGFGNYIPCLLYAAEEVSLFAKETDCKSITIKSGVRNKHPSQKPASAWRWFLSRCPGDVVLDPFLGSGTTLVVAKAEGRNGIGIEIEEKYCEIAANRLRQEVLF